MTKSIYVMMMVVAAMLNAQELLPELAGPAAKHKATNEALDKQRTEAIALATKSYLSVLEGIEKTATAKGELELVAAVVKEREATISGSLDPELPTALPKAKLQSTRKTLLTKLEQLNVDFAKRKKLADADYLRFLATLQTKAASNPELAKQFAREKAALLAGGAEGGSAGTVAKVARGKNVVVNGDFEKIVDGKPDGWKNGNRVTVETENNNTFVRFKQVVNNDGTVNGESCVQEFEVPNNSKAMTLSARIRTKDCVLKKVGVPASVVTLLGKDGKPLSSTGLQWSGKNGSWKTGQREGSVPRDAVTARLTIANGSCLGQIDFDDIEVTFK